MDIPSEARDEMVEINLGTALKKIRKNILLSEVAEEISYIKLETTEECIIEKIEKLVRFKDGVFISNESQFFQFDTSGHFIRTFGSIGKGPGEYIRIADFAIDAKSGQLSVYDNELSKIINYSLDGDFLNEFQIESYPSLIAYDSQGNLNASWVLPMFFYNENYAINSYDDNGKVSQKMLNRSDEDITEKNVGYIPSTSRTRFQFFNDTLSYWEINYPFICRLADGKVIPRYKIINNYEPEIEDLNTSQIQEDKYVFSDLIESSRFIFLTKGLYKKDVYHVLYDKVNKTANAFQIKHESPGIRLNAGFINDLDGGYPFLPLGLVSKDQAYGTFLPFEMKNMLSDKTFSAVKIKDKDKNADFIQLIEASNAEDNPIVMIVKLKSI